MQYPNDLSTASTPKHNTYVNKVAENLRALMKRRGISENRLATETGVPQPTIHRVTSGKARDPRDGTLRPLANFFGVSVEQLRTTEGLDNARDARATESSTAPYLNRKVATTATPSDYVRIQQLDGEAGMGGELINDDYPEVIRAMDFTPGYIRQIVGFVPPPGRLVLITGRGDSMQPVIQPGDVVVVDTGVNAFDGDGLYLINMGSGHQIKRLLDRGAVHVSSDNRNYGDPFPIPEGTIIGGKVYLRTRIERFN